MQHDNRHFAVRRVLVITLVLNLLVAGGKITVGLLTGALAITADGFHSLMDGASNVAALVANALAARPPDEDHPYGHRRFETLAALLIGGLLLLTAWEIAGSAFARLRSGASPELTPLAFAVMLATLFGNIAISRYQIRQGKRLNSELLLADAANTSADVFVTLSVLVSMVMVVAFGWAWVDLVAALIVVVLIARAAWNILRQTSGVLVDTAPYTPRYLTQIVEKVPAVRQVVRARSRGPSDAAHIDVDVQVDRATTAAQTAAIADAIRGQLAETLGGVQEIEVHFVPDPAAEDDVALIARACADAHGLATHEVHLHDSGNQHMLELHVEVPPEQTLDAAHAHVSALEADLLRRLPAVDEVLTHIEPAQPCTGERLDDAHSSQLKRHILSVLQRHFPLVDWHHLRLYTQAQRLALTLHAALPPELTIEQAHATAEAAETLLRSTLPELSRVTIHTEPGDHD